MDDIDEDAPSIAHGARTFGVYLQAYVDDASLLRDPRFENLCDTVYSAMWVILQTRDPHGSPSDRKGRALKMACEAVDGWKRHSLEPLLEQMPPERSGFLCIEKLMLAEIIETFTEKMKAVAKKKS